MVELWDAYDENGELVGKDLVRGEEISQGLYHIVSEILVRHEDGSFLLMQRDFEKKGYPGMFEASAAGSALKGESPEQAIKRELFEETGIVATDVKQINFVKGDHTFYYIYFTQTNIEKDAIVLQEGETIAYEWISEQKFIDFVESKWVIPPQQNHLRQYIQDELKNKH